MPEVPEHFALGRYRVVRFLGRGGMGEVYLAEDLTLGREVAIKVIRPGKLPSDDARRNMLHEARAAAALDHPFICAVYETGETPDGQAYIVMQYVEGETLSATLRRGPMQPRDALALAGDICEALGAAHRRGIVHRDLKPGNVIVMPSGHPKLLDFGIAKELLARTTAPDATTTAATASGMLVGTPGSMSPEQLQQHRVDGRSDLFSLGTLLFECLTGQPAFQGSSPVETMAKVLHVHPPPPSKLNSELDTRHDELCRRLLAKEPADRFQSADEVIGAIRLFLSDTAHTAAQDREIPTGLRLKHAVLAAVCAIAIAAAFGVWRWTQAAGLPPVPSEANAWYQRGTEAVREGAYYSGRRALDQALQLFPGHALAYARRAEANAELDDEGAAKADLLRVASLVSDESRLPAVERLRLEAVRALVLRDLDVAIARYTQLATENPADAGLWLDLGRAQEAAGLRTDARTSYGRAIERNRQYAAAYLRLGFVEAADSRRDEALAAFAEAERLHVASSDVEGQTEVLIRRGAMFDTLGDLKRARADLERARALATSAGAIGQQVRTRLALSSVTASEGHFTESAAIASEAVREAVENGFDTVAADGLVDLSASVMESGRIDEAIAHAKRAIDLADRRTARRTAARAKVQLAELYQETNHAADSLALLDGVLPFLKKNRYRRLELLGLSIASRSHEQLDHLEEARQISSNVLSVAEAVKDDAQVALAATGLASVTTALGHYPDALRLRDRVEAIHRRQGYGASLPYDLTNRADLLIRLGRTAEADKALTEVEAGISAGVDSYVGRAKRVAFLRGFAAATTDQCHEALRRFATIKSRTLRDTADVLSPAIAAYCGARSHHPTEAAVATEPLDPTLIRERHYWLAAAALRRKDAPAAIVETGQGLAVLGSLANDDLRWRLAGVGALAADQLGDEKKVAEWSASSKAALERIRSSWGGGFGAYADRRDLAGLRKKLEQIWNRRRSD